VTPEARQENKAGWPGLVEALEHICEPNVHDRIETAKAALSSYKREVEQVAGEQHVTLDWGREKVHLASGHYRHLGSGLGVSGFKVEEALCGYVAASTPKEGTLDAVDREFVCKRCLKKGGYSTQQETN